MIRVTKETKAKSIVKLERRAERDNHPLLSSEEFRRMATPRIIVWAAAQMDPWAFGDGDIKLAFKKIADAIWDHGSDHVDDLVVQTVIYSLIFLVYSDRLFQDYPTPF
jgi:hypothetical protein